VHQPIFEMSIAEGQTYPLGSARLQRTQCGSDPYTRRRDCSCPSSLSFRCGPVKGQNVVIRKHLNDIPRMNGGSLTLEMTSEFYCCILLLCVNVITCPCDISHIEGVI
jgi:hypothetical protein